MSATDEFVRPWIGIRCFKEEPMRFLCLYTADQLSQPTPEHMAQMGKYVEQQFKAGEYIVNQIGAPWAAATGWAIINAPTRQQAIADIREFLSLAGDGVSEVI